MVWLRGFQHYCHQIISVSSTDKSDTAAKWTENGNVFRCWIGFHLELGTWIIRKLPSKVICATAFRKPVTEHRNNKKSMDFTLANSLSFLLYYKYPLKLHCSWHPVWRGCCSRQGHYNFVCHWLFHSFRNNNMFFQATQLWTNSGILFLHTNNFEHPAGCYRSI